LGKGFWFFAGYFILLGYFWIIISALMAVAICYFSVFLPFENRGSSHELGSRISQRFGNSISYIKVLDSTIKKKYEELDETQKSSMDQCAICLNSFTDEDQVVELKCDKKHIFHEQCIKDWLKRKLECPLCKEEVKA